MRFLLSRRGGEHGQAAPDLLGALAAHQEAMARAGVLLDSEPATGRSLLEVRSREEAQEWLRRWPVAEVPLELRRVDETEQINHTTGGN